MKYHIRSTSVRSSFARYVAACTFLAIAPAALALDGSWNTNKSGNWSTPTDWTSSLVAGGIDSTATFATSFNPDTVTLDSVVTIGHLVTSTNTFDTASYMYVASGVNGLVFQTSSGSASWTVSGALLSSQTITLPITLQSPLLVSSAGAARALVLNGTLTGSVPIDFVASGTANLFGPLITGAGSLTLFGSLSGYTGTITATSGVVAIATSSGIPFADGGGTVSLSGIYSGHIGSVTLSVAGSVTFDIGQTYLAPVRIHGNGANGTFAAPSVFNVLAIDPDAVVVAFNASNIFNQSFFMRNISGGSGGFEGGGSGSGGTVTINAPQTFTQGILVQSGTLNLQATNLVNGAWQTNSLNSSLGIVNVNASNTVNSITLYGGQLIVPAGVALTSTASTVNLDNGAILSVSGTLNASTIIKDGAFSASIAKLSDYTGQVIVRNGQLNADDNTSSAVSFSIANPIGAAIGGLDFFTGTVFLNDALGNQTGAFIGETDATINLGPHGSIIGNTASPSAPASVPMLRGVITGGSLTLNSTAAGGEVEITGSANTYTGATLVREGALILGQTGKLTTTSAMIIENNSELRLDDSGSVALSSRLAPSIPVEVNDGKISLYTPPVANTIGAESLGNVIAESGQLQFEMHASVAGASAQLTIQSLSRNPGTIVSFRSTSGSSASSDTLNLGTTGSTAPFAPRVFITNAPTLQNGIIGGWAFMEEVPTSPYTAGPVPASFATYGSNGVAPYALVPLAISAADASSNVYTSGETLTADHAIFSLNSSGGIIDLGGHNLSVASGGILNSTIQNGSLIATDTSNGELYVRNSTLNAQLADRSDGPTSLILSGTVTIGGSNTYTGPTTADHADVTFTSFASVPSGSDFIINGSSLNTGMNFNFDSTQPLALKSLTLSEKAYILTTGNNAGLNVPLITLEDVAFTLPLSNSSAKQMKIVGTGLIDVYGNSSLNFDLSAFQGTISVNYGAYFLGGAGPTSTMTIYPGGHCTGNSQGLTILDGGAIDTQSYAGLVHVTADSQLAGTYNLLITIDPGVTADLVASLTNGSSVNLNGGTQGGLLRVAVGNRLAIQSPLISSDLAVDGMATLGPAINSSGSPTLVKANSITIGSSGGLYTGRLDIITAKVIVETTSAADKTAKLQSLAAAIASGRAGGNWSGNGITSDTALLDPLHTTVALFDNADLNLTSFGGQTVGPESLLITSALLGDANFDNVVDGSDLDIWYAHRGIFTSATSSGDFNDDGHVDGLDFDLWYSVASNPDAILAARGFTRAELSAVAAPESATLLTLLAPLVFFLRRRRQS